MEVRAEVRSSLMFFVEATVIVAVVLRFFHTAHCSTDLSDVQALQVLYSSLNSPSQLSGWNSSGGDPCGDSWTGVTCLGSSVVSLNLSGLGLNGTMGYLLNNLASLTTLDLSNNSMNDRIPYQLPPKLTSLNLARNNLTGGLPYSISAMSQLGYLNLSGNKLSQNIGDLFTNHPLLATLDASFNNFTGDLPPSFSSLTNLSALQLQDNQFSGSLNVLVGLPLTNLNVADNNFSGWIPNTLLSIPNFIYQGNSFFNGPAPPPPPYTAPPPGRPHPYHGQPVLPKSTVAPNASQTRGNHLKAGAIVGIIIGSLFLVVLLLLVLAFATRKGSIKGIDDQPSTADFHINHHHVNAVMQEQGPKSTAVVSDVKSIVSENGAADSLHEKTSSMRRIKSQVTATSYTVAALQTATNNFSQENLVGEGSLGRVYRATFSNGKVMAVKKIDSVAAASLQEEDAFLEAISNLSRLRHPNIASLVGYCAEHGQRLLVHDFIGNGNLHDMLHFDHERRKSLMWNARVRIALGTARALEYLHEVCLPPVVHRNLKSANILLDDELTPHLSDCGFAVLSPNAERQVSSAQIFGYSAPEFSLSGIYTVKTDVYSFGVAMLELLTGRKPLDSSRVRTEQSLVRWATPQLHDIDALAGMVDPSLDGMYPAKSLSRLADIIALCVQPEPEFRPPMSEVVQALVRLMQRASAVKL
ncbi:hypothetical protein M569_05081 [Genlisea aurea]|uniref:Protein kinase domain-containing protein n=1 Tax=Genlisea aurea TaxID=192259 RepID=S8CXE1_9LAMI|nr:hypothetical protein M569_05081 [Genlisea aurea]